MRKIDIPGENGCALIMEKHEIDTISRLLHEEGISREISVDYVKRLEKEFNLAAGLVKEPEKSKEASEELTPLYL